MVNGDDIGEGTRKNQVCLPNTGSLCIKRGPRASTEAKKKHYRRTKSSTTLPMSDPAQGDGGKDN